MGRGKQHKSIGNVIAPPRFLLFVAVFAAGLVYIPPILGLRHGVMAAFDVAAIIFFIACIPLVRDDAEGMRLAACRNDANRLGLLLITVAVTFVILAAVASELLVRETLPPDKLALIVGTLAMSWLFSNFVYALHYAHLFYREGEHGDAGGLQFPGTTEPDYGDFLYFSYCLGMTFQTSDVTITAGHIRRVVTLHCLAAFVFNLGVIAFSINVLGG